MEFKSFELVCKTALKTPNSLYRTCEYANMGYQQNITFIALRFTRSQWYKIQYGYWIGNYYKQNVT